MQENILLTIRYFDMFDYPLKKEELWQWLFNTKTLKHLNTKTQKHGSVRALKHLNTEILKQGERANKNEFERELIDLIKVKKIEERDGYYFLPGREKIIKIRQAHYQISLKKIKKAQRISRLLAWVPGVRMIAAVSNLGYLNADTEADIDLFIVARHGKIWSVRFWCVVLMKLLRQRPTAKSTKDKICLSYFTDEDNLNLKSTAVNEPDIHLVYLLAQYLLIYDQDDYWQKYVQQNSWINEYLPNFQYTAEMEKWKINFRGEWLKRLWEKTEMGFENVVYKNIQLAWMAPVLKHTMNRGDKKVIINDRILKLHVNDKREEINSKIIQFPISN